MFIAGVISGILISFGLIILLAPKLMFTESESKFDFATTKDMIEKATPEHQWSMPHQYDLQTTMLKHGFKVDPVTVYSVCKPDIAVKVLDGDAHRHISAMMPCRIAVYEKTDGKTYIARMNTNLLARLLGREVNAVMGEAGKGAENILESIIQK
ncbi:MAG: DUF302 domain-containing protein [Mangrovibacterium sp.]